MVHQQKNTPEKARGQQDRRKRRRKAGLKRSVNSDPRLHQGAFLIQRSWKVWILREESNYGGEKWRGFNSEPTSGKKSGHQREHILKSISRVCRNASISSSPSAAASVVVNALLWRREPSDT